MSGKHGFPTRLKGHSTQIEFQYRYIAGTCGGRASPLPYAQIVRIHGSAQGLLAGRIIIMKKFLILVMANEIYKC